MKIITTKERVLRFTHNFEFKSWQVLYRYYYIFGIKIFKLELDCEDIPSHVVIGFCCFGDSSGWKSKFMPFGKGGWR
jgi:hypothetical protein